MTHLSEAVGKPCRVLGSQSAITLPAPLMDRVLQNYRNEVHSADQGRLTTSSLVASAPGDFYFLLNVLVL